MVSAAAYAKNVGPNATPAPLVRLLELQRWVRGAFLSAAKARYGAELESWMKRFYGRSRGRLLSVGAIVAALALGGPAHSLAQCVIEGTARSIDVRVVRGDGGAMTVGVRATPVAITVPSRPRAPLAVEVRGALVLSGTTISAALALRAGTYAGGLMVVEEDGRATIASARVEGSNVRVDVAVGGIGELRDVLVPCEALMTLAPSRPGGSRQTRSTDEPRPVRLASRRARIELRPESDGRASLVVAGLEPWNAVFETVETSGAWTRVRAESTYSATTLVGWIRTRALVPPRSAPRSVTTQSLGARCGAGYGGPHDPEHALVAPGTPVSLVAGGPGWTTTAGDRSFLVSVLGDHAELLAAPGIRADRQVRGCPVHIVLGTVPTSALDREVFADPELLVRRDPEGGLRIERRSTTQLRADLLAGDVVIASGVPLDRRAPAYVLVRDLVSHGSELPLTVLRDGVVIELPPLEDRAYRSAESYRSPSALEVALDD